MILALLIYFEFFMFLFKFGTLKSSISISDTILSNSTAIFILDTIGSASFWNKLGLILEILRPLTIDIRVLKCRERIYRKLRSHVSDNRLISMLNTLGSVHGMPVCLIFGLLPTQRE